MKISFGMIILNGEPFIRYNLESLYPHAHEILIVEGAVEKFSHAATPDGHSTDNTVDIIRTYPDPGKKIKLIQRDGFWPEKDDMANAYMDACTGDYIWQVDVDEFYKAEDIEKIRSILAADADITRVDVRSVCFWRSFRARIYGATLALGADEFIRIFAFKPGFHYLTHRPPTLVDESGQMFDHKKILHAPDLELQGIVQYHYSYVFTSGVNSKSRYYSQMGWGKGCEDGLSWANTCWAKFTNPLRIHLIDFPPSWIEPFDELHPPVIQKMIEDIKFEENREINDFLQQEWKSFAEIGRTIVTVLKQLNGGFINKCNALVEVMKMLRKPYGKKSIRANGVILKSAYKIIVDKIIVDKFS